MTRVRKTFSCIKCNGRTTRPLTRCQRCAAIERCQRAGMTMRNDEAEALPSHLDAWMIELSEGADALLQRIIATGGRHRDVVFRRAA